MTVYDVTITIVHRYNGSYRGKGRYLENVAIIPSNLEVLWAYTVNLRVNNVSTVNSGTKEDPIASLLLELHFDVSTVIKKSQVRSLFQFRGDSGGVISPAFR